MSSRRFMALAASTFVALLVVPQVSQAGVVNWTIASAESSLSINAPDQKISVEGLGDATIRVRNSDNTAWTYGRTSPIAGTIATDLNLAESKIQFLDGSHNIYAVELPVGRPNPAAFDINASNELNPDGQYTNTSAAHAAFAAKVRLTYSIVTFDVAYIAMRDVALNLVSEPITLSGGGPTLVGASGLFDFGLQGLIDVDALPITFVSPPVQAASDAINVPFADSNTNSSGFTVTDLGTFKRLVVNINTPMSIDAGGFLLNGTITGQLVAYSVPEPSSYALAFSGLVGAMLLMRRRG